MEGATYYGHPSNALLHTQSQPRARTSLACAIFTHLVLFITVFLAFIYVFNWPNPVAAANDAWKFNWHPVLMVSAFVLFMGEAIMAYRLLPFDHNTQKLIHLILQSLALAAASTALTFIVQFHQANQIADFYDVHSVTGIAAYCLFCVQYLLGVAAFFWPKFPNGPRAAVLPYHKYIGVVLFFMVWAAMLTGVMDRERIDKTAPFTPPYRMANALGAFLVLSAACILYHFSPVAKADKEDPSTQQSLLP